MFNLSSSLMLIALLSTVSGAERLISLLQQQKNADYSDHYIEATIDKTETRLGCEFYNEARVCYGMLSVLC